MIILCVSSNLAFSLGALGALSMIRFRTAVKDPVDLMYLFWSVAAASPRRAAVLRRTLRQSDHRGGGDPLHPSALERKELSARHKLRIRALASVEALLAACKTSLRGKVCAGGRVELTVELKSACGADLPERIGALPGVESASLVSYNGDYAA